MRINGNLACFVSIIGLLGIILAQSRAILRYLASNYGGEVICRKIFYQDLWEALQFMQPKLTWLVSYMA